MGQLRFYGWFLKISMIHIIRRFLELKCEEGLEFDWDNKEEITYVDKHSFLCEFEYM